MNSIINVMFVAFLICAAIRVGRNWNVLMEARKEGMNPIKTLTLKDDDFTGPLEVYGKMLTLLKVSINVMIIFAWLMVNFWM